MTERCFVEHTSVFPFPRALKAALFASALGLTTTARARGTTDQGSGVDPEVRAQVAFEEVEREEMVLDTGPPPEVQAPTRLMGTAEVGVGWLTLPAAEVCVVEPVARCRTGDTTPLFEVWNFVRLDLGLAFGAGITLGLFPTTNAPSADPPGVNRTQRRGYMTIESMARYYPYATRNVEAWVGAGVGLVIVSDSFESEQGTGDQAFVGTPGVILRTEGLSVLGGLGVAASLSEHWFVGGTARLGRWYLPDSPTMSPLGDVASLTGANTFLYAGLNISFRSRL